MKPTGRVWRRSAALVRHVAVSLDGPPTSRLALRNMHANVYRVQVSSRCSPGSFSSLRSRDAVQRTSSTSRSAPEAAETKCSRALLGRAAWGAGDGELLVHPSGSTPRTMCWGPLQSLPHLPMAPYRREDLSAGKLRNILQFTGCCEMCSSIGLAVAREPW